MARQWKYAKLKRIRKEDVIEEKPIEVLKDERVLGKRPIFETVRDLGSISFWQKVKLLNYFNRKESGALDEDLARRTYYENQEKLKRVNSLKAFLYESCKRNLEVAESQAIDVQIDPKFADILDDVIDSKLFSSYNIRRQEHDILTPLGAYPIFLRITLKEVS